MNGFTTDTRTQDFLLAVLVTSVTKHESALITLGAAQSNIAVSVTTIAGSPAALADSAGIHPVASAFVANTGDNVGILK